MTSNKVLETVTRKSAVRNTVIIGVNRIGLLIYDRMQAYLEKQNRFLGFLDIYDRDAVEVKELKDIKYLGSIKDLVPLVRKYKIDFAYIAIHNRDLSLLHKIVGICNKARIDFTLADELNDVVYGHSINQIFKDLHRPIEISFRRICDILISFILLIFLFPSWLVVGLMIKLDSKGPILYSQERVGRNGRIFRIFKFRTMFTNAETLSGPTLASKNDPRITKVGLFLRKTRIDEIPQLINVLIGDMSFIGPRPERPYFVEKYTLEIPMYKNRLKMRPGITGLAQVYVGYDTNIEDVRNKLKYDLLYLENMSSLFFNIKILFKTFLVVVTGQGQ